MSQIDWSKAPDWATHYGPETERFVEAWYLVEAGKIVTFSEGDLVQTNVHGTASEFFPKVSELISRPASWNGEGLPSVGDTIERLDINANWVNSKVMYVGTDRVVLRDPSGQEFVPKLAEFSRPSEHRCFRPARTAGQLSAEQKAAEDRKRQIDDMYQGLSHSNASETRRICTEIFDKGYRKQEAS